MEIQISIFDMMPQEQTRLEKCLMRLCPTDDYQGEQCHGAKSNHAMPTAQFKQKRRQPQRFYHRRFYHSGKPRPSNIGEITV